MALIEILALAPGLPRTDLGGAAPVGDPEPVVARLFPGRIVDRQPARTLREACRSDGTAVYAGVFGETVLMCGAELGELVDLDTVVACLGEGRTAFRVRWDDSIGALGFDILDGAGDPVRELMVVDGRGVAFDLGPHLDVEEPFWGGMQDPDGRYSAANGPGMPFGSGDFAVELVRTLFGFGLDGTARAGDVDIETIRLAGFTLGAAPGPDQPSDQQSPLADESVTGPAEPTVPVVIGDRHGDPTDDGPLRSGGPATPTTTDPDAEGSAPPRRGSWWRRLFGS